MEGFREKDFQEYLDENNIDLTKPIRDDVKQYIAENYSLETIRKYLAMNSNPVVVENIASILGIIEAKNQNEVNNRRDYVTSIMDVLNLGDSDINKIIQFLLLEIMPYTDENKDLLTRIKDLGNNTARTDAENQEFEEKKNRLKTLISRKESIYNELFRLVDSNGTYKKGSDNVGKIRGIFRKDRKTGFLSKEYREETKNRFYINKLINKINRCGDNSTKGMKMIMGTCACFDPNEIGKQFKANETKILQKMLGNIEYDNLNDDEKRIVELIKKRIRRYFSDYKRKCSQM